MSTRSVSCHKRAALTPRGSGRISTTTSSDFFADLALNVQLPLSPNSRGCLLFEQPDVVESREPARHVSGFLFTSNAFVEVFMILVTAFRQAGNDKPPHPRLLVLPHPPRH